MLMLDQIVATGEQPRSDESFDWRVIARCQQGDRDALRTLFEAYKDRVYSIAMYSLGGDEQLASDVTQQVFIKLMTRIGQFRGDSEFATWLYRLVVNTCRDEQRKQRRWVPLADSIFMTATIKQTQSGQYASKELAREVQRALSELKPKLRWPLLLRYVEGLSYEEIGRVLGCSKGTVASRLNRGHSALGRKLGHLRGELGPE
jgi:RNA polymerase sigma-70 factor (ECF subfamily)